MKTLVYKLLEKLIEKLEKLHSRLLEKKTLLENKIKDLEDKQK